MSLPVDCKLQQRLESVGIDPTSIGNPRRAWQLLFSSFGTRVTISDRYAIEAAAHNISIEDLTAETRIALSQEVLESQFPGIELIGEPSRAPVYVVPYDDRWPLIFATWRDRIRDAVPPAVLITHVGSTAVPGLAAKPVVDIQISVADLDDEASYVPAIEDMGVLLRSRDPQHRFFRPPADQLRVVHIHVCAVGSCWEQDHILFRDFLRNHPQVRDAYAELKTEVAAKHLADRLAYTDAKTEFILDVLDEARRWAAATGWKVPPA